MLPMRLYLYAGVVLAVVLAGGGLYLKGRSAGKASGEAIAAAAVQERDQAISALKASQEAAETARKISESYHDEIDRLRTRKPARSVRVCQPASLPGPAGTAPRVDEAGTPGGQLQAEAGRDIGPDLYSEADRADEIAARLRALQSWLREVR